MLVLVKQISQAYQQANALARTGQNRFVPELPEVESLAIFLRERAVGRIIDWAASATFAVLKTYQPDLSVLTGREITGAARHGKFLDLVIMPVAGAPVASGPAGELHLITHLARAGWLRWRDSLPDQPPRPGKGSLAFRLRFTDGAGFDLTEAGTRKRLAVYLVTDPAAVPGIASLGPDPLAEAFTPDALASNGPLHPVMLECMRDKSLA